MKGARKTKDIKILKTEHKDYNLVWGEKKQKKYLGPSKETQVEIFTGKFSAPTYWLWFLQITLPSIVYCILHIFSEYRI